MSRSCTKPKWTHVHWKQYWWKGYWLCSNFTYKYQKRSEHDFWYISKLVFLDARQPANLIFFSCVCSLIDLLTSRAFERVARLWARSAIVRARSASERARSASERKLVVRAGSYHTRPENQANDFEKVYPLRLVIYMLNFNISKVAYWKECCVRSVRVPLFFFFFSSSSSLLFSPSSSSLVTHTYISLFLIRPTSFLKLSSFFLPFLPSFFFSVSNSVFWEQRGAFSVIGPISPAAWDQFNKTFTSVICKHSYCFRL